MGKLYCGIQLQQWNNGIVKSVTQNCASQRYNNIPLCALCLSIFNVLAQSFSVLKVSAENEKGRYSTNEYM